MGSKVIDENMMKICLFAEVAFFNIKKKKESNIKKKKRNIKKRYYEGHYEGCKDRSLFIISKSSTL